MAMTVTYSVVPRKNPAKKDESAKYYAQAQASGELDFEELCEGITSRSTCTETDVRAAISGILYEAKRALKAGRIVRLGDLGSLQIGLNSEGAVSVKEFSSSLITAAHIIFRPGKTLADITKILSYQQVTTRAVLKRAVAAMKEKTMTKVPVVVQTVVEAEKLRIRQHDNFNIESNERNCN